MRTAIERGYQHVEAFCLMHYQTEDCSESEWLWNSRDGVTPFCIRSRSGREMRHVDWHLDVCDPGYQPPRGSRIFADVTPARAEASARRQVDRYWDHPQFPMSRSYASREQAIADLTQAALDPPGQPDVIEVTDEIVNAISLGNRLSAAALLALAGGLAEPGPTVPLVERPLEMPRAGTTDEAAANRKRRKAERRRRNQGRHRR